MDPLRLVEDAWLIHGPLDVTGTLELPGDKSLAHRAILLAALGDGESLLRGIPAGTDVQCTWRAVRALGIPVQDAGTTLHLRGRGLHAFAAPDGPIDCGNSGTTMRLLCGLLAPQAFPSRLVGDASLSRRPMGRIAAPLGAMGARLVCEGAGERPPLQIEPPPRPLRGVETRLAVDSAQVRTALLLAALHAQGTTRITPHGAARDHTQRMLRALDVPLTRGEDHWELSPTGRSWQGFDFDVPGDLSAAAFFVAWCLAGAGSLRIGKVGLNPGRAAYLTLLREAGAGVQWQVEGVELGEPWGSIEARGGLQRPLVLRGDAVVQCLDEIPALLAGCAAAGVGASVRDAAELRVKESDRLARSAELLRAFGATVREWETGLELKPGPRLRPARVSSHGDHRLAMAAAVLAARAEGTSRIDGVDCVRTSYPSFAADFRRLASA